MIKQLIFNKNILYKYNYACPRYTSYPTALQFNTDINYNNNIDFIRNSNKNISLYFHIPFCLKLCYFCACNKIISKNKNIVDLYVNLLIEEIKLKSNYLSKNHVIKQLHFGGGTPTFLSTIQIAKIFNAIDKYFNLDYYDKYEYSIEVDPRNINKNVIKNLKKIGFNRISIGIQDFDLNVQSSINRVCSFYKLNMIFDYILEYKFKSINVDIIYGLPNQNLKNFFNTLEKIIFLNPNRISLFNYAHMPNKFKSQKLIDSKAIPILRKKIEIFIMSVCNLINRKYNYVGMDHFAKIDDELFSAQYNKSLYRNFQGYSTHSDCDVIGFGVTSISSFNNGYFQNVYKINEYKKNIYDNKIPFFKSIYMTNDDKIRKDIIMTLMCNFVLNFFLIESKYKIKFHIYFKIELLKLRKFFIDGLCVLDKKYLIISDVGRFFIRNICSVFDIYYYDNNKKYSKSI